MVKDSNQHLDVYLDALQNLRAAIENGRYKRHMHGDKLGHNVVLAYDELTRTLVICVVDNQKASEYISAPVVGTNLRMIDFFEASYPRFRCQVYSSAEPRKSV